ncbi:Transcription and mRNA export factor ENY2 [Taenia solium]|eukprot:TsM_001147800 transcript=TsM_001147800 gene=TsM_001147800
MGDKRAELRTQINDLLNAKGEREKIREMIEKKLVECGWNDRVKGACKEFIRSKGVDVVNVDDVVEAVAPSARGTVPPEVKASVLEYLRKFLAKNGIDVD